MIELWERCSTRAVGVSISGKDITVDGGGHSKTAARNELMYDEAKSGFMVQNQKPTAYV